MKVSFFKPLKTETDTFNSNWVGSLTNVISYSITKSFTEIGEFILEFSLDNELSGIVKDGYILYLQDGNTQEWLVVRNIQKNLANRICTISGTDLKGLLAYRITLYSTEQDTGTQGYDVVQGTTGECCNHYVNNNLVNTADANRKIIGVECLETNSTAGITNDTYMSRFEFVSDVVQKLCENAGCGWDIIGNLDTNTYQFIVSNIVDKSANQTKRSQVYFATTFKNISNFNYVYSSSDYKNAFYATQSGGALESDAVTTLVTRSGTVASGYNRKEMQLNVSCELASEVATYALHDVADYVISEAVTINVANGDGYGDMFQVGDKVTAYDKKIGMQIDDVIYKVQISKSKDSSSFLITIGKEKKQILKKINTKINQKGV